MGIDEARVNKKYLITSQFLWKLVALIQILRIIGVLVVLIFPDVRNIHDFFGIIDVNDGRWYYSMAFDGFIQYLPGGELYDRYANFSTLFPILLSLCGQIIPHEYAPFVFNTLCTIPIPWLAAKFAVKLVPSNEDGPTEEQAWRQRLIVIGITLNPIFLGFSIYALTEPLFYLLLLVVLNCNQRQGTKYVVGELVALFFMGWAKFTSVIICAYYLYQLVIRDFLNKNYKHMLRPLACIILAIGNFLFWSFIFPLSIWGITASASMEKWWDITISFNPNSLFFFPKLGVELLAILGVITVFRLLCIRQGWGYFGMREKYLADLRRTKRTPVEDGYDPKFFPEFDQSGKHTRFNYELIEALMFWGFCLVAFHGLFDPLVSFIRYIGAILPFFACISIQNRAMDNTPGVAFAVIIGSIGSGIGVSIYLIYSAMVSQLPVGLLPPEFMAYNWVPDLTVVVVTLTIAVVLFFKYYYHIKHSAPKMPDLKKIFVWLSICSVILMFAVLYMP